MSGNEGPCINPDIVGAGFTKDMSAVLKPINKPAPTYATDPTGHDITRIPTASDVLRQAATLGVPRGGKRLHLD